MADLERERRAFFERNLARMERAWRAGVSEALVDAVALCERWQQAPPAWISRGVRELVAGAGRKKRGRLGNPEAARRQDMIHYARWDAVRECRDRKGEPGIPGTWEECYAAVAGLFAGTPAGGSEETIKSSYQLVERKMKAGGSAGFYIGGIKPG